MGRKAVAIVMLTLIFVSMLTLAFNVQPVKASGIIYIRPDGSIDPSTAPIQRVGDTYTFTSDIYNNTIEVQRDNITLNGNEHLLQGSQGNYYGIYLNMRHGVKVTNVVISGFVQDISLDFSSNNEIISNTVLSSQLYGIRLSQSNYNILASNVVKNTYEGISLYMSNNNTLSGNTATDNEIGIRLLFGTKNIMRNNVMAANKYNFDAGAFFLKYYINDIDTSNTVDRKPIYYWINRHDETVPMDAGVVVVVNSTGITVRDLKLKNSVSAVTLAFTTDSLIENVTATENANGIMLDRSDSNIITGNNITDNDRSGGISLDVSAYNFVTNNFVSNTNSSGIWLEDTSYNTVIGNTVINSRGLSGQEWDGAGVMVDDSSLCKVTGNTLIGNWYGIVVGGGGSNLIVENNIERNDVGLQIVCTRDNSIYHNNFIESKKKEARISYFGGTSRNTLDSGYLSGGNYWTDYSGWDNNGDGIGDLYYVIDESNKDHYPLMSPYGGPPLPTYMLTITTTIGGITNPPPGNYRHSQGQKIPVNATSCTGYEFDHWELDGANVGKASPINIAMNADHTLRAVFGVSYTLAVSAPTGGTTNPTPGTYTYVAGTVVNVTATPSTGYYLDHWELDGANNLDNPISVTMNTNHALKAVFKELSSGHDVAIKRIASKTVVGQGYPLTIQVTAINIGSYTETFNVTVYANTTSITTQTVTLSSGESSTLIFTWNASGFVKGSYTISANATPVPDETDTTDNTYTDGSILVTMLGDVDGPLGVPDGRVDGRDIAAVAKCLGTRIGQPGYEPNYDINDDGKIDGRDIAEIAKNFGTRDQ